MVLSSEGVGYAGSRCQRAFDRLGRDPDFRNRTSLFPITQASQPSI
jgi:hypothetical protein